MSKKLSVIRSSLRQRLKNTFFWWYEMLWTVTSLPLDMAEIMFYALFFRKNK